MALGSFAHGAWRMTTQSCLTCTLRRYDALPLFLIYAFKAHFVLACQNSICISFIRLVIRMLKNYRSNVLKRITWTLTQTSEQMLSTLERKILRRIYGPTHEGGCWRPRWNNELYSLYNEPNIEEDIKIRKLEWAGHIIRMEEKRIPKKVLNGNSHTTRPVGRPRTRWANVVQRDALQLLRIRRWRRRAANRDEWRYLMREAKAQKGLQHHGWMDGWMECTETQKTLASRKCSLRIMSYYFKCCENSLKHEYFVRWFEFL